MNIYQERNHSVILGVSLQKSLVYVFVSEGTAGNTRTVIFCADGDAVYVFKVGAVYAEPFGFGLFLFGLEFLATHGWTMVHSA